MNFLPRSIYLVLLLVFILPFAVIAQTPSRAATQPVVLNDMSERTGQTITINSMSFQQWFYGSYTFVRELGCPLAPASAPTSGNWQRFEFTYSSFVYIYLVSENLESLILCNEPELPTQIPPTNTPIATQPIATPDSTSGGGRSGGGTADSFAACSLLRRLSFGGRASVTPGDPNWVHSEPNRTSTKIGEIPGNAIFNIIGGPICDPESGMVYWFIDYGGLEGWTSEGLGEYWLEPAASAISVENISSASLPLWLNLIPRDSNTMFSLSPNSERIAITTDNNMRVYGVDGEELGNVQAEGDITVLTFTQNMAVLFGTETGQVAYVSPAPISIAVEFRLENPIGDILVTADDRLLIVAEENGTVTFWNLNDSTAPIRTINFGEDIGSLEFNDDQTTLIIRDVDGYFISALTTQ